MVDTGIKGCHKNKNKLYKKYLNIPSAANEVKYKTYRNKLNHILQKAKKQHFSGQLVVNKNDLKKTWQIMQDIVNKNKKKKIQTKFKVENGGLTSDSLLISNKFNDFFVNIGPSLAMKIPKQTLNPLQYMGHPVPHTFFLSPVTHAEINQGPFSVSYSE